MQLSLGTAVVQLCSVTQPQPSEDTPCPHAPLHGFTFPGMYWMLCGASSPGTGREHCQERDYGVGTGIPSFVPARSAADGGCALCCWEGGGWHAAN